MPEPQLLSARAAAQEIAAGRLTAEALMTACLDRIAAREKAVGAWHFLDPAAALAAARQRDSEPPRGPLHGIPIAVKDLIDTADMPTGYGSAIYRDHHPAADAACVALARAAGAVVLGKTVTTEFACFTAGKTANPHNPAHTPGGSSSGSAASVADGMVPLAFGTQTAGSVIRPAAYCGCVGYKPSFGTIPRAGVKPLADSLDTIGVMARTVDDAAFFTGIITERPALRGIKMPGTAPRFGLYRTPMWGEAEPSTIAALDRARAALERAGAWIAEIVVPPEERCRAVEDVVYLPDGTRLEAHSGLGQALDNPRFVAERAIGPTPPHVYDLTLRESLFHGVQALRLNPVGDGGVYGRGGFLAHPFMLGPNGDSNGCVSFKDYDAFLRAYQNGQVKKLAVVAKI